VCPSSTEVRPDVAQVDVLTGSRDGDAGACECEDAVLIVSPKVHQGWMPKTLWEFITL